MARFKMISLVSALLLLSCTVFSTFAFADVYPQHYTVSASGERGVQTEFYLNGAKPWLYIQGDNVGWWNTTSTWTSPLYATNTYNYFSGDEFYSLGNEVWIAFGNARWSSMQKEGTWEIASLTDYGRYSSQLTSFTVSAAPSVTPEPVSALLFAAGGAMLALRRKQFRKTVRSLEIGSR